MRIVVDLDGVICAIKKSNESYADLLPIPGAIQKLEELKQAGHYIIIQTARNMATCDSNLGKVMKNIGQITLDWLSKHNVPYDEIFFGKPNAHVYIDDRGLRFNDWREISHELLTTLFQER